MSEPLFADDETIAPPRRNGELVFEAPWEGRVFGVAAALCERGVFSWDEFRVCLITEIADWERRHALDEPYRYYARWQAALERLLVEKGLCSAVELDSREHALASRPAGHDHAK
ncbi:MAG: nitrile hydratase accessory protein [Myxococcota bacterium]